jgi:type II secretory pathway pseudopilin PulG
MANDIVMLVVGFILGVLLTGAVTAFMLRKGDRDVANKAQRYVPALALALLAMLLFGGVAPTLAQTPEVSLDIPIGTIFTESNNWINIFAPVAAIGIGIGIAIAVLNYVGKMIKSAF